MLRTVSIGDYFFSVQALLAEVSPLFLFVGLFFPISSIEIVFFVVVWLGFVWLGFVFPLGSFFFFVVLGVVCLFLFVLLFSLINGVVARMFCSLIV